ncbi:MAG: DUF5317 domain-containing protein [Dethiobacteria bacterium]|jgi:hypothetical protein|nr:DUF5317 domain-containing protein [Bacillota bacterium]HOP69482.1 DUF5317 domain-containing protein [Bacillota bacterium]HPT34408.1 DUF5317 domain-containing protein [Bacillota bacterium]HPZ64595.1 DUF5317 domain-containing protein [Bacillota bacterium]HQD06234.1 DUF5317 domain-containing protein [Bacillota bacterium]
MFLEAAVLGLLVGWARKGKLSRLGKLPLKSLFLVLLAFLIQLLLMVDYRYGGYLSSFAPYLHIISYLPLLAFIFLNRKLPGILVLGLGLALNLAVIAANGGTMPVSLENLPPRYQERLLSGSSSPFHSALTEETRLSFLGDIFQLPYGRGDMVSLGDIFLAAGLFWFIQQGMQEARQRET